MPQPGQPLAGRVLGTEDATPLEFWMAIAPEAWLQLDDVVALRRKLPDGQEISIYGVVTQVRARHEGARFDSDVFLIADGVLPAEQSRAALIMATRFEPEMYVPPLPGDEVYKATDAERDMALFFNGMERKLAAGLSRDQEPNYLNFDFINGSRGAHINISGISGVATKTTYATFLLYAIFNSKLLGNKQTNTKTLIFNVKGEDLLFLDCPNKKLNDNQLEKYEKLGLTPGAFPSVEMHAPPQRDTPTPIPDVHSRKDAVNCFFWTLAEFCKKELFHFLFTDAQDDRQQYTMIVHNVETKLEQLAEVRPDGGVTIEGQALTTFDDLVNFIGERVRDESTSYEWAGRAIGQGTINAFIRRLNSARRYLSHLIRGNVTHHTQHQIKQEAQVTVVDIHNLNDRAQRFVVGVLLTQTFDRKEQGGRSNALQFVVLDELNKYAPREGSSPIKEVLLDIAERGRSLGIILIGAQQTASEVERRIVSNSSIRVVGRLDAAEASRGEYGFLPQIQRKRATLLKPGTMIVSQPELPVPLVLEFPFPAWATKLDEAVLGESKEIDEDALFDVNT